MGWVEEYYTTLRQHNENKCGGDCRHCKRIIADNERVAKALSEAKLFAEKLKTAGFTKAVAAYNGGYDEDYVDYMSYYKGQERSDKETYTKYGEPWDDYNNKMHEISYGVLGYGFGTGDFSTYGSIILDVENGVLYNNDYKVGDLNA